MNIVECTFFYMDDAFQDLVIWPPCEMGNNCLKSGQDYAVVNRKRSTGESGQDVEDSGGRGGSYRKTVNAAKYEVPKSQSSTDLNKNKPTNVVTSNGDEGALNLQLQTPVPEDEDVGVFFEESRHEKEISGLTHGHRSPGSNGGVSQTVETNTTPSKAVSTHVEVFNLNMAADTDSSPKYEASTGQTSPPKQPDVVHINLTDYVAGNQSPNTSPSKSSTRSGAVNPVMVTDLDATTDSQGDVPVTDLAKELNHSKSDAHVSDTSTTGIANEAFDISDEQETVANSETIEQKSPATPPLESHDVSEAEVPDDEYFFFGMESLKFQSKTPSDYDGEEADREVAEIMSALDIIEDRIWTRLKAPEDDTDSAHWRPDAGGDTETSRQDNQHVYDAVLSGLKDVCNKVEDILKRKGIESPDEYDANWLSVPDFSSINERYDKGTMTVQSETSKRLLDAADHNDEQKAREVLEDYKRQQERLLRMREAEKRKLLERLGSKISSRRSREFVDEPINDVEDADEESDHEQIQEGYGAIISTKSADNDSLISSDNQNISEEEPDDTYSSSDEVAVLTEADVEATLTLKQTLKDDISSRITEMTSDDFQSIMGMYRKERQSIRDFREAERGKLTVSLWDKLADRRRYVDECSFEESTNQNDADMSENQGVHESAECNTSIEQSPQGTSPVDTSPAACDVATETDEDLAVLEKCVGVTQEDLAQLNRDLMGRTLQKSPSNVISQSEADRLLREHFNCVKKLREQRDSEADRHRKRLAEKLGRRKELGTADISNIESSLIEGEDVLKKEEGSLERRCLEKVRRGETITNDELKVVLDEYTASQHSLIEQRIRQRTALNQRLRDKLAVVNENRIKRLPERQHGEDRTQTENQIKSMDDAFYQSLLDKRQAGELSATQLAQLIDEHLDLVDEFKKEVRTEINKRRKERRRQADSEKIAALVQQDKENSAQVRRLREQERHRTDGKLQEMLQNRKQKTPEDAPELVPRVPPKKPERKRRSSKSTDSGEQPNPVSYENVQPQQ